LWAAEKGHEAAVQLLLEKGDDLESKSINSQSPLLSAAENRHEDGHKAVVKLKRR
jgi:ankyrin repeat protein